MFLRIHTQINIDRAHTHARIYDTKINGHEKNHRQTEF